MLVAWLLGKCFCTDTAMSTGKYWKYSFFLADIHVNVSGMNNSAWKYLIKSCRFYVWFILFSYLVGSTWRICLLGYMLCSGSRHNTVWWHLHPFRMLQTFLIMLTYCLL